MTAISDEAAASLASLERFFSVLVETIRDSKPAYLVGPFTVAEIYQSLIPYRTHRDRLGVEMNGDYEDSLLRLLAGEGEFLQMESEQASNRIRKELGRKNPNSGVYREFAAAEVRLNPARVGPATNGSAEVGTAIPKRKATVPEVAEPEAPPQAAIRTPAEKGRRGGTPGASTPVEDSERPTDCPTCGGALPDRATLQFCPHCGKNTRLVPCRSCGEELDRSWRFCVACGEPAT